MSDAQEAIKVIEDMRAAFPELTDEEFNTVVVGVFRQELQERRASETFEPWRKLLAEYEEVKGTEDP